MIRGCLPDASHRYLRMAGASLWHTRQFANCFSESLGWRFGSFFASSWARVTAGGGEHAIRPRLESASTVASAILMVIRRTQVPFREFAHSTPPVIVFIQTATV